VSVVNTSTTKTETKPARALGAGALAERSTTPLAHQVLGDAFYKLVESSVNICAHNNFHHSEFEPEIQKSEQ
jgi:hypothetical protein